MRRFRQLSLLAVILCLTLAACGGADNDSPADAPSSGAGSLGPLDWDRSPNTIILRVDQRLVEGPPVRTRMEIPPCTLWGDGRVVWVNDLGATREVLEARLNDDVVRGLIETVVFSGFYDWESDFLLPEISDPEIRSITLNLFAQERTVLRYDNWPANGYERIRAACQQASTTPVRFQPQGVWVSAYEVPYQDGFSYWRWLRQSSGFTLAEVAHGQPPRWVTGDLARLIWESNVEPNRPPLILDDDLAYELVAQVPNIMRDAPPAPSAENPAEDAP